jgi:protein-histidine pros-kinase
MKLLGKFNWVFAISFGTGLLVAAYFSHVLLQWDAKNQVVGEARLMMETAASMRSYTSDQVAPLIQSLREQSPELQARFNDILDPAKNLIVPLDSLNLTDDQRTALQGAWHDTLVSMQGKLSEAMKMQPAADLGGRFHPQIVPAYAATEGFKYLRAKYPDYTYKEATLNPTNLQDRTTDWEADIVNSFRNDSSLQEIVGMRATPLGAAVYLARPIKITETSCLECHSTPDAAPASMIKAYGTVNGFGWKLNETVGAQLVQVPEALPLKIADHAFYIVLLSIGAVFLCTLAVLNLTLYLMVIKPVSQLSATADQVSAGKLDAKEIPIRGKDEISVLANSFNRMKRSLVKALEMLGG